MGQPVHCQTGHETFAGVVKALVEPDQVLVTPYDKTLANIFKNGKPAMAYQVQGFTPGDSVSDPAPISIR